MTETKYYKGYGIVSGDGLFNDVVEGVTSILSSNRTKDVITEGANNGYCKVSWGQSWH